MSETQKAPERNLQTVRTEYFQLATRAGDLAYRLAMEKADLEELYEQMKDLNQEGARLEAEAVLAKTQKAQPTAPVAPQPEAPVEPVAAAPEAAPAVPETNASSTETVQ